LFSAGQRSGRNTVDFENKIQYKNIEHAQVCHPEADDLRLNKTQNASIQVSTIVEICGQHKERFGLLLYWLKKEKSE
jgi:hypothetical protein